MRDALLRERDERRGHYASIEGSIEAYRREYEKVEAAIGMRERELIQLSGYYEARSGEDQAVVLPFLLSCRSCRRGRWSTSRSCFGRRSS